MPKLTPIPEYVWSESAPVELLSYPTDLVASMQQMLNQSDSECGYAGPHFGQFTRVFGIKTGAGVAVFLNPYVAPCWTIAGARMTREVFSGCPSGFTEPVLKKTRWSCVYVTNGASLASVAPVKFTDDAARCIQHLNDTFSGTWPCVANVQKSEL